MYCSKIGYIELTISAVLYELMKCNVNTVDLISAFQYCTICCHGYIIDTHVPCERQDFMLGYHTCVGLLLSVAFQL